MQITKVTITKKKQQEWMKVFYDKPEYSKDKQQFDTTWTKNSNQPMSRKLSNSLEKLIPHLLWATELTSREIILDENIDERKFFNEFEFHEEERFNGVVIERIDFIGTEQVIESVKLYGYRETQLTEKAFKVKLETPVINLDRAAENHYALVVILDEQISDLMEDIKGWLVEGETLSKAQQEMFVQDKKAS